MVRRLPQRRKPLSHVFRAEISGSTQLAVLRAAIRSGNIETFRSSLDVDLNDRPGEVYQAIKFAIELKQVEMAHLLESKLKDRDIRVYFLTSVEKQNMNEVTFWLGSDRVSSGLIDEAVEVNSEYNAGNEVIVAKLIAARAKAPLRPHLFDSISTPPNIYELK